MKLKTILIKYLELYSIKVIKVVINYLCKNLFKMPKVDLE